MGFCDKFQVITMPHCRENAIELALDKGDVPVVALAGNPNSGKTTIFNGLTGLRQKVANYPGVTVEKKTGTCKLPDGRRCHIVDLPGTYSLISHSPDEYVAMEVLRGLRLDTPAPQAVIAVVDASNLQRNLYLVSQLIELRMPMVVALNMMDVAERRGLQVDAQALSAALGVPVVPLVGHKRRGIDALKAAILQARIPPMPDWILPQAMHDELLLVGGGLAILESETEHEAAPATEGLAVDKYRRLGSSVDDARRMVHYQALAERLLIGDSAADMTPLASREPVKALLESAVSRLAVMGIEAMQADIEAHYHWIEHVVAQVTAGIDAPQAVGSSARQAWRPQRNLTERVDGVLIHKIWGLLIFALIMGVVFVSIFWAAQPMMDGVGAGIDYLGLHATGHLPAGPLKDLLKDGVFAGVGTVVKFVPQIALLFLFLSILEDSGYLARAAFLMDRLLAKVGLHGKSFIPLLSSFACAIPGIMATRTIEHRKDRLATIMVAPFMSCAARLPVYGLLITTFFAAWGTGVRAAVMYAAIMLSLYVMGIAAAAITAWFFKRSLLRGAPAAFILELPTYKVPQASQVARQVWNNTWAFLTRAGTIIFCMSVILWAVAYYPRLPSLEQARISQTARARYHSALEGQTGADTKAQPATSEAEAVSMSLGSAAGGYSYAGRLGHAMEPVIRPLGFDWKMGVGLVSAFAARELFVSTMGIIYAVGDPEERSTTDLSRAMRGDRDQRGQPVWTPLVAVSLLIWFVLALQCMSTVAIVRRETGGWRWPVFMILYMNGLAYVVCLGVYQVGLLLGA